LPRFHPAEALAGAGLGAGAGGLYHAYKKHTDPTYHGSAWTPILGGAALGGLAADVIGDRARRYLSNTLAPASYQVDDKLDEIRPTANKVWTGAILDQPTDEYRNSMQKIQGNSSLLPDIRYDLQRRALGVPERFHLLTSENGVAGIDLDHPRIKSEFPDVRTDPSSQANLQMYLQHTLGAHQKELTPGLTSLKDSWDFDLHENERERLKANLNWFTGLDPEAQSPAMKGGYSTASKTLPTRTTELMSDLGRVGLGLVTKPVPIKFDIPRTEF
jgi:hypothetical protein